jgi:hypothetical protein
LEPAEPTSRFHVELRSQRGMRRAWAFNLTRERLTAEVLEPWRVSRKLIFGDREWEPRESELRILEGPAIEPPDLAHGQGPNSAERTARDVTGDVLAELAGSDPAISEAARLLAELSELRDVSPQNEQALDLVAERLRSLGLS